MKPPDQGCIFCTLPHGAKLSKKQLLVITISEVTNREKRSIGSLGIRRALFFLCAALVTTPAGAESSGKEPALHKLGDCNWLVTYRGRTYDLSPLTRESLARPIENDIRFALQRVPEANERLEAMDSHLRNARAHTILASIFMSGLLVTKILEGRVKNQSEKHDYRIVEAATGTFFLTAALFSWKSTLNAKEELVHAVEQFNEHSPFKMEPASAGVGVRP